MLFENFKAEDCTYLVWVQIKINLIWRDYFISIFKEVIYKHNPLQMVRFQDPPDRGDLFQF